MKQEDAGKNLQHNLERAQDLTPAPSEIAEAARFPEENPNPVFRVGVDGCLLYANRASQPLMTTWGVALERCVPTEWRERFADVLTDGEARKWDALCNGRVLQLHCVPVMESGYINVYGADVTERVALESQLRESETKARDLIRHAPTGIYEVEFPSGRFRSVNDAMCTILGYTREELFAMKAFDLLDDEGKSLFADRIRRTLAGEFVDPSVEYRVIKKDGSAIYGVLDTRITYQDGRPTGAFVIAHDVTERRRAADELARQRAQLQDARDRLEQRVHERTAELEAIFASVPDALYVADVTGVRRCNQAALDAFGCKSVDELKEMLTVLAEKLQSRYADTGQPIPSARLALARALRGERAVIEAMTRNPVTGHEQIHRVAAGPIVLNGEIVAAVALATDITEQKRSALKLAYQAQLLENVNDAIMAYDADMRITAWNKRAEEQYGWKADEVLGAYAPDVVGSWLTEEQRAAAWRELTEAGRWQGEIEHTRRDGTRIAVDATAVRLCDQVGCTLAYVTVNRDITERKRAEAELKASREQLRALSRRLVAMQEAERNYVADQLFNQAAQVLAALQMQLSRLRDEGEASASIASTVQSTLNEAIRDLHRLASELRPVGLDHSTLARVLEEYACAFGKTHGLAVRFDPGGTETLRTPADVGTALFRSVQEGLTNVTRHAQASEVALSLRAERGWLTVTLADNGVGFEPASGSAMSGLGLASVRERLETVGGTLTILSGETGTTLTMKARLGNGEEEG